MAYNPSIYQQDIFDFIKFGYGNGVINAKAGSGKSTTAVQALDFIKPDKKVLFLAFNNSIVEELQLKITRLNTDVKTLHSLGYSILNYNYKELNLTVDEYKYKKILNFKLQESDDLVLLKQKEVKKYKSNILKLIDLGRFYLIKNESDLENVALKHNVILIKNEIEVSLEVIREAKALFKVTKTIDFGDMLYLPNVLPVRTLKYDFIFVDEAQDLSQAQMQLFLKCFKQGGRFICIGDEKQCQPAGTKISMSDGKIKNIEDLEIGDKLVSYNTNKSGFYGYYPNKISYEKYNNFSSIVLDKKEETRVVDMYTIKAGDYESRYTYNHLCMAKFNFENSKGAQMLYLMQEKNRFRIGITPLFTNTKKRSNFGLRHRAMAERAEKIWILNIYKNRREAYNNEQIYSFKYGIPQTRFIENTSNNQQKNIDFIWEEILRNNDLLPKAIELLNEFNKKIDCPFWVHGEKNYISREAIRPFYACNIFPIFMEFAIFDTNKFNVETKKMKKYTATIIDTVKIEKNKKEKIYSLDISNEKTYVADGILTHNCINAFVGSDIESFTNLKKLPNVIELPLSICYRCPSSILDLAKKFVPDIEPRENAPVGYINYVATIDDIGGDDMVICRNTLPLVKLYIMLLNKGVKAYIKGKDVGDKLISLVENIENEELNLDLESEGVFSELYGGLLSYIEQTKRLLDISETDVYETQEFNNLLDSIECLEMLSKNIQTKQELLDKLTLIFKDNENNGVCLSTIHKAKGLEADNVFILNRNLLPSKYVKQDWELEQEKNLEYVALTRSKKTLGFIYSKEFNSISENKNIEEKIIDLKYKINKIC